MKYNTWQFFFESVSFYLEHVTAQISKQICRNQEPPNKGSFYRLAIQFVLGLCDNELVLFNNRTKN